MFRLQHTCSRHAAWDPPTQRELGAFEMSQHRLWPRVQVHTFTPLHLAPVPVLENGPGHTLSDSPYPEYSRANFYLWDPFPPEAGLSRTRSSIRLYARWRAVYLTLILSLLSMLHTYMQCHGQSFQSSPLTLTTHRGRA